VDLKELGDPADAAAAYTDAGADELVVLDITATVERRRMMLDTLRRVAARTSLPITAGGGVRGIRDVQDMLTAGATHVSINTAAVENPTLVEEAADEFGSECITVAIDVRRNAKMPSGYEVMVAGGRKRTGRDAVAWALEAEDRGAAALLPTSMNTDGTLEGYDIAMTRAIAQAVSVPVIASGGAGKLEHLAEAIIEGEADAVLVASIAHFGTFTIRQMKEYLTGRGIPVRPIRRAAASANAPEQAEKP
jgi:cyclase